MIKVGKNIYKLLWQKEMKDLIMGITPDSCFVRVCSSVESMNGEIILNLFSRGTRNLLKNILVKTLINSKIYY